MDITQLLDPKRNLLINSGPLFDQRWVDTYTHAGGGILDYILDRWQHALDEVTCSGAMNRQAFSPGELFPDGSVAPPFYMRWSHTSTSADGTKDGTYVTQKIEDVTREHDGYVTFSVYMKADSAITVDARATQFFGTGGSPSGTTNSSYQQVTLTTEWKRYTFRFFLPTVLGLTLGTNGDDYLGLALHPQVNTSFVFDMCKASAVSGSVARPYEQAGLMHPYWSELELCQRYFEKTYNVETLPGSVGNGELAVVSSGTGTNCVTAFWKFATRKRSVPIVNTFNPVTGGGSQWRRDSDAGAVGVSNLDLGEDHATFGSAGSFDGVVHRTHATSEAEL